MPLDPQKILNWKFPEIEHTYTEKDTMLYALGLGCGSDPDEPGDLKFVYERGLVALPTMAVVLAYPGNWLESKESTADYSKVLHGEQSLTLHRPIPPAGTVVGRRRIMDLLDKGKDKGAVLYAERADPRQGERRADRHHGLGRHAARRRRLRRQARPAAARRTRFPRRHRRAEPRPQGRAQRRLIYRLSGDRNPLHADPAAAAKGGFKMPILHGLCTYGVAGRAIVKACCGNDPARLKSLQVRFSSPVFPGETIRTEMWPEGERVSFRARVVERDVIVLNNGLATLG